MPRFGRAFPLSTRFIRPEGIVQKANAEPHAGINVTETSSLVILQSVVDSEPHAGINVTETSSLLIIVFVSDSEPHAGINVTEGAESISATVADAEPHAGVNVTEAVSGIGVSIDEPHAGINVTETDSVTVFADFPPQRLRVDVYSASGVKQNIGPLVNILAAEYVQALDQIGSYKLTLPADDVKVGTLTQGAQLWVYRESEGLVFKGTIDQMRTRLDVDNRLLVDVSGSSIARQLVWANVLFGLSFTAASASSFLTGTLAGTGWSNGTVDVGLNSISARFDGTSVWETAAKGASVLGVHIREDLLNKAIDFGAFGDDSGLVFRNVEAVDPALNTNTHLFPITKLELLDESTEVWNRIIPIGTGQGVNKLDLQQSSRATPYTIQSATGPDGLTYYYIEDAASQALYGIRTKIVNFKDIVPVDNSTTGFLNASNALYDAGADYLDRHKNPLRTYKASVVGVKHVDSITGVPKLYLGQTARLQFNGVLDNGVVYEWLAVDTNLYIMGWKRSFDASGADTWDFTVTTVDRLVEDGTVKIAQAFSDIKTEQLANKPFAYRETFGPRRQGVDSGFPLDLTVVFDKRAAYIHEALLEFHIKPLRSNVTTAAAGGGTTVSSAAGAAHTHTITPSLSGAAGGGTTVSSAGGSAHSHTVSATTSATTTEQSIQILNSHTGAALPAGSHNHASATTDNAVPNNPHQHTVSGGSGTEPNHSHDIDWNVASIPLSGHTHSVSGQTAAAESSHTHSVTLLDHTHSITGSVTAANESTHTHNVTLSNHTHALTYGIFENTAPATPLVNVTINGVNRTAALGGGAGWNTDQTVDIVQYLLDTAKQPLRGNNTISLSVSALGDLEVTLRCFITSNSLS